MRRGRGRVGFTLVEPLVLVSTIAMYAVILFPVIVQPLESAQTSS